MIYTPGEGTAVLEHRKNALLAAGAGTCFGIAFIAFAIPPKAASVAPLFASRISGIALGAALIARAGGKFWISKGYKLGYVPGLLGIASLIAFVLASHLHYVATVSIVQGLAPLFTALLAFIVLRQKLRPLQLLALLIAFVGTSLLAAG